MSRLIDELKKVDRASSQPMGFGKSHQASTGPRLRLITSTQLDDNITADSIKDADAVLLLPEKMVSINTIKTTVEQLKNMPWGIYLQGVSSNKAASFTKEGCDFFVFPTTSLVSSIPTNGDTGRIIEVESSLDDGLLKAVNDIPVDAVLLTDSAEADDQLVWHRLMIFQRMVKLLTKPVITRVPLDTAESDIKALWEAGVDGVIAKVDVLKPDGVKNLRKLIDNLPARTSLKKGSSDALIPYPRESKSAEPEPDEEDDWE